MITTREVKIDAHITAADWAADAPICVYAPDGFVGEFWLYACRETGRILGSAPVSLALIDPS